MTQLVSRSNGAPEGHWPEIPLQRLPVLTLTDVDFPLTLSDPTSFFSHSLLGPTPHLFPGYNPTHVSAPSHSCPLLERRLALSCPNYVTMSYSTHLSWLSVPT